MFHMGVGNPSLMLKQEQKLTALVKRVMRMCSTGQKYLDWVSECYLLTKDSIIWDEGERGFRLREGTTILFIWRDYDKLFAVLSKYNI